MDHRRVKPKGLRLFQQTLHSILSVSIMANYMSKNWVLTENLDLAFSHGLQKDKRTVHFLKKRSDFTQNHALDQVGLFL